MIEKGSRHEYIARTNDITYPKNMEDYLEKAYPKNPDLFTDEVFEKILLTVRMHALLGVSPDKIEPKKIVESVIHEKDMG